MMENITSVALYTRVSTDEQVGGYSLDAQREVLLDYCRKTQSEVFKVYVDAGRSGKSIEGRPALMELLDDAKKGCFQKVVCLRLNRLSRNLADLLSIVELFDMHSISLHSLTEQFQTETPVGKFVLQMMGATAQLEREQISQNVKLGMQKRNTMGKWNSGNQVLGYRWIPHPTNPRLSYVTVVPEEANLVGVIFEWYASGLGFKAITNRLNQAGHRTKRDKSFSIISVRNILTNWNYIGRITFKDAKSPTSRKIVDGGHDPIIPIVMWEQVQQQLSQRSHPFVKTITRHYPLSGLLKCPDCGHSMIPSHARRQRKNGSTAIIHYYVCTQYNSHGSSVCLANAIRADAAEGWISDQVQLLLTRPSIVERLVSEVKQKRDKILEPFHQKLNQIDAQIASLKKRSLRCYELFEDGHLDNHSLKSRLEEIRSQSDTLDAEKAAHAATATEYPERSLSITSIRNAMDNFRSLLKSASPEQQKGLFNSLIDKIVIPPDRDVTKAVIHGKASLMELQIPPIIK